MSKSSKRVSCRDRLLLAGMEIFALRGYSGATVREISLRAKSNIAAINYYFSDKAGFYETLRSHASALSAEKLESCWAELDKEPWEALRQHIIRLLESKPANFWAQLNCIELRELMDGRYDLFSKKNADAEEAGRGNYGDFLVALLTALLGEKAASAENVRLLRHTFQGLCLFLAIHAKREKTAGKGKKEAEKPESLSHEFLVDYVCGIIEKIVADMQAENKVE